MIFLETEFYSEGEEATPELVDAIASVIGTEDDYIDWESIAVKPSDPDWEMVQDMAAGQQAEQEDIVSNSLPDSHGWLCLTDMETLNHIQMIQADPAFHASAMTRIPSPEELMVEVRIYDKDRVHFRHYQAFFKDRDHVKSLMFDFLNEKPIDVTGWFDITDELD